MNQIINMILRQITRRLVNKGVSVGFAQAGKLRRGGKSGAKGATPPVESPAVQSKAGRQAKQAMKVLRRTTKF